MINDFIISIFQFIDGVLSDTVLDKLGQLFDTLGGYITTYFPTVLRWMSAITFFVPKEHIIVFLSVVGVLLIIRIVLAIYDQVAQVIP